MIEERIIRIEKKLDQILNILMSDSTFSVNYRGRKFLGLENVFDTIDNINPMIRQGDVYTIDNNNQVHFHFGTHYISMSANELLNTFGNKIFLLTDKSQIK